MQMTVQPEPSSRFKEKWLATKIEELEPEELAEHLGSYHFNTRTVDGGLYKLSSLENFRHSLNT